MAPSAVIVSRRSAQTAAMAGRSRSIRRKVKSGIRVRRSRVWSGGSITKNCPGPRGGANGLRPGKPLRVASALKRGSASTARASSYRDADQGGRYGGAAELVPGRGGVGARHQGAGQDVQGAGPRHGRRARRGRLELEVVRPDQPRQRKRSQQTASSARDGGEAEPGDGEATGDGERGAAGDVARGDGALGAFHGVDGGVGVVVEGHAGPVEADGGADGREGTGG